MWRTVCTLSALVLFALSIAPAADVRAIVTDYDEYKADPQFTVDTGTVKVRRVTDYASLVVIETGASQPTKVKFRAKGYVPLRFADIRTRQTLARKRDTVELTIPEDGVGWLLVYDPPPEVSVYEYQPRSPLKVPNTGPKKARYPVVDVHAHLSRRGAEVNERIKVMDAANVAIVIDSPLAFGGEKTDSSYSKFESKRPDRFLTFATIDFTNCHQPGFAEKAIRRLEQDVEQYGVVGVGETHDKGAGMFGHALVRQPTPLVHIDDARLMPLWKALARMKFPLLVHVADPPLWYEPADRFNEHLVRIARSPQFHVAGSGTPPIAEMLVRQNRILEQAPDLAIIGAHMASSTEDLAALAKTMRKYPNLYPEIGVRQAVLAQQPRVARKFFIEFQDRILYGADGIQTLAAYRNQWRIFETDDDCFAGPGTRIDPFYLYGLDLPEVVLKKLYYANAARLMPEVKRRLLELHPDLDFPE